MENKMFNVTFCFFFCINVDFVDTKPLPIKSGTFKNPFIQLYFLSPRARSITTDGQEIKLMWNLSFALFEYPQYLFFSFWKNKLNTWNGVGKKKPGESFGKEFIPRQSELFRIISIPVSEPMRINPKKAFNLILLKIYPTKSKTSIRMNPNESEHYSELIRIIRNQSKLFWLNPKYSEPIRAILNQSEVFGILSNQSECQCESIRIIPKKFSISFVDNLRKINPLNLIKSESSIQMNSK